MSEDKQNNVNSTIDAVAGLAKAIPIYDDALQPAAKEIGKSLATVAKTVNIALAPVSVLVWGYEKIKEYIDLRVSKKLENVPFDNIVTPDPSVVGPALEALRFTGNSETLSEMYANLIATSMDKETVKKAHPGFVEIIKNMCSDEGLLIKVFEPNKYEPLMDIKLKLKHGEKGEHNLLENYCNLGTKASCTHLDMVPSYIVNLIRLGLLHIPPGRHLVGETAYDSLTKTPDYIAFKQRHETETTTTVELKKYIVLTQLGVQFRDACLVDKN